MVFVYIRIYFAARARSRRQMANKIKRRQTVPLTVKKSEEANADKSSALILSVSKKESRHGSNNDPSEGSLSSHPTATAAEPDQPTTVVASTGKSDGVEESVSEFYSTAPCSLTVMNNAESDVKGNTRCTEEIDRTHSHLLHPPASGPKNNFRTNPAMKHCVTFECTSISRVSYTTIRCSVSNDALTLPDRKHLGNAVNFSSRSIPGDIVTDKISNNKVHFKELPPLAIRRSSLIVHDRKNGRVRYNKRTMSDMLPLRLTQQEDVPKADGVVTAGNSSDSLDTKPPPDGAHSTSAKAAASRDVKIEPTENEMVSEMDPSSSDSGTGARCTSVRPLKIRFCRPSSSSSLKKSSKAKRQVSCFFMIQFHPFSPSTSSG